MPETAATSQKSVSSYVHERTEENYVVWFESFAQISEELWQSFPADLEGVWWYEALEKSGLDDQFIFKYGVVYINGKAAAVVPAFIMDIPIDLVAPEFVAKAIKLFAHLKPSIGFQRTLFVGSPCADECTIGLLADVKLNDILPVVQNALKKLAYELHVEMIVWKDMPAAYQTALKDFAKENSLFELISYPGTEVPLTGNNFSDYLKNMKGSRRYNLKKKLRLSHEYGKLDVSVIQNPNDEILDEIFQLFWQTYEKGKTKLERLNKKFFSILAQVPVSWFVCLREPDSKKLVAFMLCFTLDGKVINKFVGLDYSLDKRWYIYFRLWEAAVDWAYQIKAEKIQSGQTGYRAKIDVGHGLTSLMNYCCHNNPFIHFIMSKVSKTVNWASLDDDLSVYLKAHPSEEGAG